MRRLVAAGGVVTTVLGLAVLVRLWQVFPFECPEVCRWSRHAGPAGPDHAPEPSES
jgi:hypothetical protein